MKASKTLTSAVVAAALAGAIGVAYAQASNDSSGQLNTPPAVDSGTMQAAPATTDVNTAPATSADTGFQTERPAQADRN